LFFIIQKFISCKINGIKRKSNKYKKTMQKGEVEKRVNK